jgi:CubicO group peptidase (beta-lactamase class C family)
MDRKQKAGRALLIIVSILLLCLIVLLIIYPSQYIYRGIMWAGPDVYDYRKFPSHEIENAPPTFYFKKDPNEELVSAIFESCEEINNLDEFLRSTDTTAFIVIKNDTILYEKYFNDYNRDSIQTSFSVAKSFDSALVGIAIDEGHIKSVDEPITNYLPELKNRDDDFETITIRDLLMMSSGIRYKENRFFNGDDAKVYYYPDMRKLALEETSIIDPPGEYFLYNNYHPLLLGLILERATNSSVSEYLQEKIWKPLGMEYPASWSIDSEKSGFEKMESGLNARAIDFAKFGRLFLNNGAWDGEQIISEEWVARSTQIDTSKNRDSYYPDLPFFTTENGYYKYFWWGYSRDNEQYDYFARGNFGQYIYVSPQKDLIIVRHGKQYGINPGAWPRIFFDFAGKI